MTVPTVWLEDESGRRWPLAQTCSLGRSASNDVVIEDGKVSRRHALVHKQDDAEHWVIDLGSGNGTYLNGRRVIQPTRLDDGDALSLGDHSLRFRRVTGRISQPRERSHLSAQTIINIKSIDCWMLVADIKGSTAMAASLSPTDMAMQVGRWMATCKEIIDTHDGAINKFLGDGFFAYWHHEPETPRQFASALTALMALQRNRSPRFRLALHRGAVAFGGGGSLGEDSLSGVDVVVAFRMEKMAGALGCDVLASDEIKAGLAGLMTLRDLGQHIVPGLENAERRRFHAVD
jgi:adenylate cyclase